MIREPHHVEVFDDQIPQPNAGEALIRVKAIGICGSDLHTLEGLHPFVSYPVLPGHEIAGIIEQVGAGVDVGLVGKMVALEPSLVCGTCRNCRAGRYNICENLKVMGFQTPGAMTELFATPVDRLHFLPDGATFTLGAFVEPTAVAVHAARLPGSLKGRDVAVIGAGTIGLLVAQVARAYDAASVTIVDLDASRRAIAEKLGLKAVEALPKNSVDVAFECVGVEAALRSAILAGRKGATIVIVGVFGKDASIPAGLIQDWELHLMGSLMYVRDDYVEAIRLLANKQIRIDEIVTHRYPLGEAAQAFETAIQRGGALKVILDV